MEAPGGTDVLFCLHNSFIRVLRMKYATLEVLQIAKVTKILQSLLYISIVVSVVVFIDCP